MISSTDRPIGSGSGSTNSRLHFQLSGDHPVTSQKSWIAIGAASSAADTTIKANERLVLAKIAVCFCSHILDLTQNFLPWLLL